MPAPRPSLEAAVVMRRVRNDGAASRWQAWRWELAEVLTGGAEFGSQPRCLLDDPHEQRWLYPGFTVELFKDDAEGYYLNATTPAPCWFVLWRMEEQATLADEPLARPEMVSLSYHDAGRWLDAQETVEQRPLPAPVLQWLQAFVDEHLVLEAKQRRRPQSFRTLSDRFGNPVSISTGKGRRHGGPEEGDGG